MAERAQKVQLHIPEIIRTSEHLVQRIEERFPGSGLGAVSQTICNTSSDTQAQIVALQRTNWTLLLIGIGIPVLSVLLLLYLVLVRTPKGGFQLPETFSSFIEILEPTLGSLVFLIVFFAFMWTLESRWKQTRVLRALNELRSLAHVIDMHQLTKDPKRLLLVGPDTASSPKRSLTPFELGRYLDYCTELLAILSKLSAVWAQAFPEPNLLTAVDQIEMLANGLSRKIWQKLIILESVSVSGSQRDESPSTEPR